MACRMRHTLIAWVLMVAAGGQGYFAVSFGPRPMAVFSSVRDCDVARGKQIEVYRQFLTPPIKSGYDYIEGVGVSGHVDAAQFRQLYILTCEQTRGR